MAGWKEWQIGEVVEAADFQSYVQDQVVQVYASSAARGSALGTAVTEGMVAYLADTNSTEVYDGSSWIAVGAGDITAVTAGTGLSGGGTSGSVTLNVNQAALYTDGTAGYTVLSNGTAGLTYQPISPNYIINGAFDFWQRGTSFTYSAASDAYQADRWKVWLNGTTNFSVSQEAFTAGTAPVAGYEGTFFHRFAVTSQSGATIAAAYQKIEDVRTLAGQTVTLSFWAKHDTTRTISARLIQNFGSGGSAEVTTTILSSTATTSNWARYTATATLPSISGKTIGAGSSLFAIIDGPLNTAQTLDIWGVQLEAGSVATPFRRNANSLQGELAACQRYCWAFDSNEKKRLPIAVSGSSIYVDMTPPVPMRGSPTLTIPYTNANYTTEWQMYVENVVVVNKTGTAFVTASGGLGTQNIGFTITNATWSATPNVFGILGSNKFIVSAEL